MKLAIMQPYFFPYLGYFQLINAVDNYILYNRVNYKKKSWLNRNYMLSAGNGTPVQFGIPLTNASSNKMINEVKIHNNLNWRQKFLRTVFFNYKRAPYFNDVYPLIENIINARYEYLYTFNNNSIIKIADYLNIQTKIITDDAYFNELEAHLANRDKYFHNYDKHTYSARVLRVLEICKERNADVYYNAIGGQTLYDKELFRKHNIELGFIETKPITYIQFEHAFISGLSIIDVMMFNSLEKIHELLCEYDII